MSWKMQKKLHIAEENWTAELGDNYLMVHHHYMQNLSPRTHSHLIQNID